MLSKGLWMFTTFILLATVIGTAAALTDEEKLGKDIFFDKKLSVNKNQACSACHESQVGFTGPDRIINTLGSVYEGSVAGRFGNRKPPAAAYAGDSPVLHYNDSSETWIGGMFWDGRATGETLGDPLAEQAKGPFLNPLEQALPDAACVVYGVTNSDYGHLFKEVWGSEAFSIKWPANVKNTCSKDSGSVMLSSEDRAKVEKAYNNIARSIAAYERSKEVSSFTSKFDDYMKGKTKLTEQEMRGLELFNGKANCANCHAAPLFTDFTYDNLGIPKNPLNPFYYESLWDGQWNPDGLNWVDKGLGGFLKSKGYPQGVYQNEMGKFKVPTLRNVDKRPYPGFVKAFGHNGYFKSLKQIVHFYNTRDVLTKCNAQLTLPPKPGIDCWPESEVIDNVNTAEMGNLGLSDADEDDIVAFLKTLTDRYDSDHGEDEHGGEGGHEKEDKYDNEDGHNNKDGE